MSFAGTCPAGSVSAAVRHSLGWLVFGNAVGLYLSLLLLAPVLQAGPWTYGRWVPVHLNVQLYGWTALPLVAWLLSMYEVDASRRARWGPAAVWGWTAALAAGVLHWLSGITSGKVFLDWKGGSLWAFTAAQAILWCVLASAWIERRRLWGRRRRFASLAGLVALAAVPLLMLFSASPQAHPPIDRSTGGPTGSSLLGSSLGVIGLMLLLPRIIAGRPRSSRHPAAWIWFGVSWVVFAVTEAAGGTHSDVVQVIAMLMLLPWVWLIPRDWSGFEWPRGSRVWKVAMLGWWAVLVVSGLAMYQAGVLDRLKFTQGLVAHSHLAMAGFTTSFGALLGVLLTRRGIGGRVSTGAWHGAVAVMVLALALCGWAEGAGLRWMAEPPLWRQAASLVRTLCGGVMLVCSLRWFWNATTS